MSLVALNSRISAVGLLIPSLILQVAASVANALSYLHILCTVLTVCFFLLIAEHNGMTNGVTHGASESSAGKGSRQVKGTSLIMKQFHALLVKRFQHAIRSKKDFLAQVQGCSSSGWFDGSHIKC